MLETTDLRWSGERALSIVGVMPVEIEQIVWRERLGRALATARKRAGFTQEEAGPELGVDKQTVSRWERGKHDIRLFDVVKMATLYEMPTDWIVNPPTDAQMVAYRVGGHAPTTLSDLTRRREELEEEIEAFLERATGEGRALRAAEALQGYGDGVSRAKRSAPRVSTGSGR